MQIAAGWASWRKCYGDVSVVLAGSYPCLFSGLPQPFQASNVPESTIRISSIAFIPCSMLLNELLYANHTELLSPYTLL